MDAPVTSQTHAFFHHYRAMDTRVLLLRYQSGGLLPEARAALLEVLADRGYAVGTLDDKDSYEATTLRAVRLVEPCSASGNERPLLSIVGLRRRVSAFGAWARELARVRETWVQVVRISLLAGCAALAQLALLVGLGGFVIANVFCDSGPLAKCFYFSLVLLGGGTLGTLLWLLAMFALLSPKKWIVWYLKVVPVLSLTVFVAAIHWHSMFPTLSAKVAILSALMVFLAIAHMILSRDKARSESSPKEKGLKLPMV